MSQVEGVEVWSGGVNTWDCDTMGHLNVRHYMARSLESLAAFAPHLALPGAFRPGASATLLVREQHVRFLREAQPGASLAMTAGVLEIGESEARLLFVLRHAFSGEIAATFQTLVAHVTTRELQPFAWSKATRLAAEALSVALPAQAAARSIDLSPVETGASLERARELGLTCIARGAVGAADLDIFGRMRGELFMGRISDGMARLFGGGSAMEGVGGAAVEYRLLHYAWPGAGDRVEIWSGISEALPRTRRLVHWLVDPATGQAFGAAEAIAISFDLATRKLVEMDASRAAEIEAAVVPGLTL